MLPQLVTVRYRRPDGRWRRLYVPVLPAALSPLLLLAVRPDWWHAASPR
jgi:hypothetical protein